MNLIANRRSNPAKLALHLMNVADNEHIEIHEMRGFIADDLDGAFHEAYAIARGTRCEKFLYSLILSPPETENVPIEVFEKTIEKIESKLGFVGQPRAIVFHEKKGRRHAHCVWSRINAATMTAIDPYEDKLALNAIGRDVFIEQGWDMPNGYRRKQDADPLNYSHAEAEQAKRVERDPKELKRLFIECWQQSDSRAAFVSALKEHGFILAKGNKRGHVAIDAQGEIYSIAKWVGVKAKEVRARLGLPYDLPSVEEVLLQFDASAKNTASPTQADFERETQLKVLEAKRLELVTRHRKARSELEQRHIARQITETKARVARIPKGLKAAWLKLSGQYQSIIKEIEADAARCNARNRAECQALIERQLQERQKLQRDIILAQQKIAEPFDEIDIASRLLKTDPAQKLIIPPDPETLSIKAKIKHDPVYILEVITDKKESFSRPDVVRALADYITDPLALGAAVDTAMRSSALVEIQSKPLPRYSTREMIATKAALSTRVDELSQTTENIVSNRHIHVAIATQNKTLQASVGASLSDQQKTAIRHCLSPEKISAVVGLAGAGKSTMLSAVRDAYERQGYNVYGAALSGKAADGLESSSGIESRTLASLERSWKQGYSQLTSNDVLVIDEVGMIGTRQLHRFVDEVKKSGAKIILVGDPEQLQPINAGAPFTDIIEQIGAIRLTENHRQQKDWQKQASLDLAEQRIETALNAYEAHGNVKQTRDTSEAITNLVEDYMADLSLGGDDASRLALTYRRKDVFAINQAIRSARKEKGDLPKEILFQTEFGKRAFAPDDRILLMQNDYSLGSRNGMLGTVRSVSEDKLEISLDANAGQNSRKITINPKLYNAFDQGYATTIHKSQGATVDKAYVLGSVLMDRHLTYVAMTRHKQDATLYGDHNALQKMRHSGVKETLNYQRSQSYTHRRRRGPTMH